MSDHLDEPVLTICTNPDGDNLGEWSDRAVTTCPDPNCGNCTPRSYVALDSLLDALRTRYGRGGGHVAWWLEQRYREAAKTQGGHSDVA